MCLLYSLRGRRAKICKINKIVKKYALLPTFSTDPDFTCTVRFQFKKKNLKGKKVHPHWLHINRNRHLWPIGKNKQRRPSHWCGWASRQFSDRLWRRLVSRKVKNIYTKNNLSVKERFTRLKTSKWLKMAIWNINNSQAKGLFLLRIWFEKSV